MSEQVFVQMPIHITNELINAVRHDHLCECADIDDWHRKLGWLICAYDAMIECQQLKASHE